MLSLLATTYSILAQAVTDNTEGLKAIGAGLGYGLAAIGPGVGIGLETKRCEPCSERR